MRTIYLITGATGHLGHYVVARLLDEGARVRVLVQPDDAGRSRLPADVDVCLGDVLDTASLDRFFAVPAGFAVVVIHMAAIISLAWGYDERVFRVNVEGTKNVVLRCLSSGARLIHISSVHAIPELPAGQVMKEVAAFNADDIVGLYGKTKAKASQVVLDAVHEHGLDAVILHPAGMVGPGDHRCGHFTALIRQAANGKLPAAIKGAYNFADVRDVAEGVVSAVTRGRTGECYILGNRIIDMDELFRDIHAYSGAKEVKRRVPLWLARLVLPFIRLAAAMRKQTPLFTRYSLYTVRSNCQFSSKKAESELGFTVRPLTESIHDTIAWMRAEGWLDRRVKRQVRTKAAKQPTI